MRRKGLVLAAAAVLALVLGLPALAGGLGVPSGAQAGNGGSITLPLRTFIGRVECVRDSDLPRYELVCPVYPIRPEAGLSRPPIGAARYILLLPGPVYRPVAEAARPDARGMLPLVRVKGALVYVPGPRGMAGAIVVQGVEFVGRQ
jgi:hypothetical protein